MSVVLVGLVDMQVRLQSRFIATTHPTSEASFAFSMMTAHSSL